MARLPVVSRTVKTTEAKVLVYNTETKEVKEEILNIPRTFGQEKSLLNYLQKNKSNPGCEYVKILDMKIVDDKYVMTVEKFIESAQKWAEFKTANTTSEITE